MAGNADQERIVEYSQPVLSQFDSGAARDASFPPLVAEAWKQYRETQTSARIGESELRAREDAFLSGVRAAFEMLQELLCAGEDHGEYVLLLPRLQAEIGTDKSK